MANTKRTFTIPEHVSQELDAVIPNRERSKFISYTLQKALRAKKHANFLSLLDEFPRQKDISDVKSEDMLRSLRDTRVNEILKHDNS